MTHSIDIVTEQAIPGEKYPAYANLYSPLSHIEVYKYLCPIGIWEWFDKKVYGTETDSPYLPSIDEIYGVLKGDVPLESGV